MQIGKVSNLLQEVKKDEFLHNVMPVPRNTIWMAMITRTGKKIRRNILLLSFVSTRDPIKAPSRTPNATGAATNGGMSPCEK